MFSFAPATPVNLSRKVISLSIPPVRVITEVSDVTVIPFPLFSITELPEILIDPAVLIPSELLEISELFIFTTASSFVPVTTLLAPVTFTLFRFKVVALSSLNNE